MSRQRVHAERSRAAMVSNLQSLQPYNVGPPNERRIRKWVQELRSGNHKQWPGDLERDFGTGDAHVSTLGVLCRISGKAYSPRECFLPFSVQEWAGLPGMDPVLRCGTRVTWAENMDGWSFTDMARELERTYLGREGRCTGPTWCLEGWLL